MGRYSRRAEASSEKRKKKVKKLDEPRNERRKVRSNSNSVATLFPSSLTESKYRV